MVAMLRVCHEAHHLHYGAQGMTLFLLKWVYLGVAEAIVGSLLCCGGGHFVQCLFNHLYYVIW